MFASLSYIAAALLGQTCTNKEWAQCDGKDFTGEKCCQSIDDCIYQNDYFSQCTPRDVCLTPQFQQCNGTVNGTKMNSTKTQCCPPSFHCVYQNDYYSQCQPSNSTGGTCADAYGQCGGKNGDGDDWGTNPDKEPTCCIPGYECNYKNDYYSGCKPIPVCTNTRYGQCGGIDGDGKQWNISHSTCCPGIQTCQYSNPYYSQCFDVNTTKIKMAVA